MSDTKDVNPNDTAPEDANGGGAGEPFATQTNSASEDAYGDGAGESFATQTAAATTPPTAPAITATAPVTTTTAPAIAKEIKKKYLPNSKPREPDAAPVETYVYRDFANAETKLGAEANGRMPPQSLQSQKLPSKLAAMLCDPDLVSVITWMPHGRSWKILNRDLFSSFALPRYFGHSNHASFVRIVNAWGFRRISVGVDRDSYYHELFLRSKPHLHQRMKRLPTCHRKTPVDKDDKSPDFYDLAKISPLPEVTWSNTATQIPGSFAGAAPASSSAFPTGMKHPSMMGVRAPYMPETVKPIHYGDATGAFSSSAINGLIGSGMVGGVGMGGAGLGANSLSYGMAENPMLSLLGINNGGKSALSQQPPTDASTFNAYTQNLQRENENLMLKIRILEYENQAKQKQQQQQQPQQQWSIGNSNTENTGVTGAGASVDSNNTLNNPGPMSSATAPTAAPSHHSHNASLPDKTV